MQRRTNNRRFAVLLFGIYAAMGSSLSINASTCTVDPSLPVSGHLVTVIYDPSGGPLAEAGSVYVHRSYNNWTGPIDDPAMTLSNGLWCITYTVPGAAGQLDYVFHDGAGTWDNNNGNDWHFDVSLVGPPPSLPADGSGANVMMQGFYWDCPQGWYRTMSANADDVRYMRGGYGIDRIWFAPPQKSGGGYSMGYDPYDYYDLGTYDQKSTIPTRFGTQVDLKNTITTYKDMGVVSMADIVLNHRDGGTTESNPNTGGTTATDFSGVASGLCTWNYNEFHPSTFEASDEAVFESYPDVCHVTGNAPGSAGYDLIQWGAWLTNSTNAGFDGGWRFDFAKGIHPSYMAEFRAGTGNAFGILEYWDGNISLIENGVRDSGYTSAFDFPGFYTMVNVFNHGANIADLIDPSKMYAAKDPERAVTFVANHDTDKDTDVESVTNNTMLAYAFILTYQGYPCIFWKDYFNNGFSNLGGQPGNGIDPLVWVRGFLGGGQPEIELLKTDDSDFLIYGTLNGSSNAPGYIVVINNHDSSTQSATVTTGNAFLHGKTLECHAWYSYASGQNVPSPNTACGASGSVTLQAPPRGYAVYSVTTELPGDWAATDIGSGDLEGSADYLDGTFIVSGAGDMGGNSDEFHFVNRSASGSCGLQARVLTLDNNDPNAKAGVMLRLGTSNAGSYNAAVLVTENGVAFQWRSSANGNTSASTISGISAPCWVRLTRSGNTFSGYYSEDGEAWTQIGSDRTISMFSTLKGGAVVSGGATTRAAIAKIDNLSLNRKPSLSAISDQSMVAGSMLILTNSATDADVPAQALSYSLIDPPSGASIGETNGMFTWRPVMAQSPSTQSVVVAVSDDGEPALSATQSFAVTVSNPVTSVSDMSITNDVVGFWIAGDVGPDVSIMRSTNLTAGVWVPVYTTNSPMLPLYWSTPASGEDQEFFRLELGP